MVLLNIQAVRLGQQVRLRLFLYMILMPHMYQSLLVIVATMPLQQGMSLIWEPLFPAQRHCTAIRMGISPNYNQWLDHTTERFSRISFTGWAEL